MIDLTKAVLPSEITVGGSTYPVHTDFHYWIHFLLMRKHGEIKLLTDCDFLYENKKPVDRQAGITALIAFCDKRGELPRSSGKKSSSQMMDFEIDADVIYAAFYEQYGLDLLAPQNERLHWYKFRALFDGLHNTRLNEIISYRAFDENDTTDYKESMKEMHSAWEIIDPLTQDEQKALDAFDAQLK